MTASAPTRAGAWLPAIVLASLCVSILLTITGGFSWHIGPWALSAHQSWPALLVAGTTAMLCAHPAVRPTLPHVMASWWRALDRSASRIAIVAAAALFYAAIHWGSFVAGGADAYGYVSQAHLWASGELRVYQPIAHQVSWPDSDWTFSPLGYRPGRRSGFIVPTYSPGLPLLMAAVLKAAGPRAIFYLVPLLGAATVWLTFAIGRRLHGRAAGAIAAVLVAASPIVLFQVIQPMSDVPVTAWWAAAVLATLRRDLPGAALAGLASSAAILTRPNLLPLAAPLGLYLLLADVRSRGWTANIITAAVFALALVPGVVAVAQINAWLYGSPLATGYGSLSDIYAFGNLSSNSRRYARWVLDSQTWFIALAALAPAVAWWQTRRSIRGSAALRLRDCVLCLTFAAVLFACYGFYYVFAHWSYIRFLLPALPLVMVLATIVAVEGIGTMPAAARAPAAVLLTTALAAWYVAEADRNRTFAFARDDRHYVEVAQYAAAALPPRAILLAVQESGTLRYYGDRLTLRWDMIDRDRLDSTLEELRQKGRPPYLVLESWEEPEFRRRFEGHSALAVLDWPPLADVGLFSRVRIYDPSARARYLAGEEVRTDRVLEPER